MLRLEISRGSRWRSDWVFCSRVRSEVLSDCKTPQCTQQYSRGYFQMPQIRTVGQLVLHGSEERLRHCVIPTSTGRSELARSAKDSSPVTGVLSAVLTDPRAQGSRIDPHFARDTSNRPLRLTHHNHRFVAVPGGELTVFRHNAPSSLGETLPLWSLSGGSNTPQGTSRSVSSEE